MNKEKEQYIKEDIENAHFYYLKGKQHVKKQV